MKKNLLHKKGQKCQISKLTLQENSKCSVPRVMRPKKVTTTLLLLLSQFHLQMIQIQRTIRLSQVNKRQ